MSSAGSSVVDYAGWSYLELNDVTVNTIFANDPFPYNPTLVNVNNWFAKIEVLFREGLHIQRDEDVFKLLLAYLQTTHPELVGSNSGINSYADLKKSILEQIAIMESYRNFPVDKQCVVGQASILLNQLELSHPLQNEYKIRQYWLQQLPDQVHDVIVGVIKRNPYITNRILAQTADVLINSLNSYSQGKDFITSSLRDNYIDYAYHFNDRLLILERRADKMDQILSQINKKLNQLLINCQSNFIKSKQHCFNNTCKPTEKNSTELCWYHSSYGIFAQKCEPPCNPMQLFGIEQIA